MASNRFHRRRTFRVPSDKGKQPEAKIATSICLCDDGTFFAIRLRVKLNFGIGRKASTSRIGQFEFRR